MQNAPAVKSGHFFLEKIIELKRCFMKPKNTQKVCLKASVSTSGLGVGTSDVPTPTSEQTAVCSEGTTVCK